jgi:hypothetical protein
MDFKNLNNKRKTKNKEELANILKDINELKESFLDKPKPNNLFNKNNSIKKKKKNLDLNKDILKSLKIASMKENAYLAEPENKINKETLRRLSSPKKRLTATPLKSNSLNISNLSQKIHNENKLNQIFNKMMSNSKSNTPTPLRKMKTTKIMGKIRKIFLILFLFFYFYFYFIYI